MKKITLAIIFIVLIVFVTAYLKQERKIVLDSSFEVKSNLVGISFPPVKTERELEFTFSKFKDLGINKVRFETKWAFREPKKGEFNWSPLDRRIDFFNKVGISMFLTVDATGPDWACKENNEKTCTYKDLDDFRNFVGELSKRYSNKIDKIQFGNEWDNVFVGTKEEFVEYSNIFYKEFKKNSPETKVVLGGLTRSSFLYEDICLNNKKLNFSNLDIVNDLSDKELFDQVKNEICVERKEKMERTYKDVLYVLKNIKYDLVDLHLYDDAENWNLAVENLIKKINKPLIVSEFGGPNPEFEKYSDEYQVERVKKYIEVVKSLPIEEAYYFKLLDSANSYHDKSGLIKEGGKKHKPAYDIFKKFIVN